MNAYRVILILLIFDVNLDFFSAQLHSFKCSGIDPQSSQQLAGWATPLGVRKEDRFKCCQTVEGTESGLPTACVSTMQMKLLNEKGTFLLFPVRKRNSGCNCIFEGSLI